MKKVGTLLVMSSKLMAESRQKEIHEAVIVDSYFGWDKQDIKSLGLFERWYDAAKAADAYVNSNSNWRYPPLKWEIRQHKLVLSSKD
jgi:hypothetical protein